jgi:hypothetical protein
MKDGIKLILLRFGASYGVLMPTTHDLTYSVFNFFC